MSNEGFSLYLTNALLLGFDDMVDIINILFGLHPSWTVHIFPRVWPP